MTNTEIRTEIQRIRRRLAQGYETLRIAEAGSYRMVAERERRIQDRLNRRLSELMFIGVGTN